MRQVTGASAAALLSILGSAGPANAELGFEPQLVGNDASLGPITVEATAGANDAGRIASAYDGYLFPGGAISFAATSFLSIGATYEPNNERAIPLTVGYGLGPLGLSHELAYHAVFESDDQWTLDSELSVDLGAGLGLFTTMRTTGSKTLSEVQVLQQAGATYAPDDVWSFAVGVGQGVRDTPFDSAETIGLFALSLTL